MLDVDSEVEWCFATESRDRLVYPGGLEEDESMRPAAARLLLDLSLRFGHYRFDGTVFGLALYLWDRTWVAGAVERMGDVRLSVGACFLLAARYEGLLDDDKASVLFVLQSLGWPATDSRTLVRRMNGVLAVRDLSSISRGVASMSRAHLLRFVYAHRPLLPEPCVDACLYVAVCCQLNLELLRRHRTGDLALAACVIGCALGDRAVSLDRLRLREDEILGIARLFVRGRPYPPDASLQRAFPRYAGVADKYFVEKLGLREEHPTKS